MDLTTGNQQAAWLALERLLRIARQDTGQARRVADFLLAWHNAEENGGWNLVDLWSVDAANRRRYAFSPKLGARIASLS